MKMTNPTFSKWLEGTTNICTIRQLPKWMGHLIVCEQDNTPKQSYPHRMWFL